MGKIEWKRLFHAMRETLMVMLTGLILIALAILPLALAIKTGKILWLVLYAVAFFVGETWEKYNDR